MLMNKSNSYVRGIVNMKKLKKLYGLYNLGEAYESRYIRYYLKVSSNPGDLSMCYVNQYNDKKKYAVMKKLFARKLGKNLYQEIMECIEIIKLNRPDNSIVEKYSNILQKLDTLSPRTFTVERWCTVGTVLSSNGLFRAGAICRGKSKERLMSARGRYAKKVVAYLENNDLQNAKKYIDEICKNRFLSYCLEGEMQYFKLYFNLLNKSDMNKYSINWEKCENYDAEYSALIKDKTIKIIGPANALNSDKEDNEYLIGINCTKEVQEHKVDAMYNQSVVAEKAFGILPRKYSGYGRICIYDYDGCQKVINKMRFSKRMDSLYYKGVMHLVPQVVMDVLINGGKSLCVEGTTLFMSERVYHDQYFNEDEGERQEHCCSMGKHDLESQFIFLKNLYHAGCFGTDDILKEILNLSVEEYLENMEYLYSFDRIFIKN